MQEDKNSVKNDYAWFKIILIVVDRFLFSLAS